MSTFTDLERAVLHSIFLETPRLAPLLERQLALANVAGRENSGAGFFTSISVGADAPRVAMREVLGFETHAHVKGLEHGMGFVLFTQAGLIHLLEGFSYSPESPATLDLQSLEFEIFREATTKSS